MTSHGASDAVFSADDTARWYDELQRAYHRKAGKFVRYLEVPGMGHVQGGPATDQFDGLGALIGWVEFGAAPERIVATARGQGNRAASTQSCRRAGLPFLTGILVLIRRNRSSPSTTPTLDSVTAH